VIFTSFLRGVDVERAVLQPRRDGDKISDGVWHLTPQECGAAARNAAHATQPNVDRLHLVVLDHHCEQTKDDQYQTHKVQSYKYTATLKQSNVLSVHSNLSGVSVFHC
jgi:hypothetical protein